MILYILCAGLSVVVLPWLSLFIIILAASFVSKMNGFFSLVNTLIVGCEPLYPGMKRTSVIFVIFCLVS